MNHLRTVHRERGHKPAVHKIDQHRSESGLDHVTAQTDDDRAIESSRLPYQRAEFGKLFAGEYSGKGIKKLRRRAEWSGKFGSRDFAGTARKRVGLDAAEIQRCDVVSRH